MDRVSIEDKKIVQFQLGRDINNPFKVKNRCEWGYPICIESQIIYNDKPFPTLFWLTCPFLSKRVGRLEEKGTVKHLERKILEDSQLRTAYLKAHEDIIELKKQILNKYNGLKDWQIYSILSRGIGGIRNLNTVKCLHLQLASFLGGIKNPIGKLVYELIEEHNCPENNVICSVELEKRI